MKKRKMVGLLCWPRIKINISFTCVVYIRSLYLVVLTHRRNVAMSSRAQSDDANQQPQLVDVSESDLELFAREYQNQLGEQLAPEAGSMIVPVDASDESEYDLSRGSIINDFNLEIGMYLKHN